MTKGDAGDLEDLFRPRSVAVIGASRRPGSVGASLFHNLVAAEFTGVIYPVNPSWASVGGVRCYATVEDLPETPDLGVVIVPADLVAGVVDSLGRRGTRSVIIISAGFKEVGGAGIRREAELVEVARRHGIHLVGPNCFGVFNTADGVRLNATFSDTLPPRGNIAFVSQSGALGAGILHYAQVQRIGFTKFVSVGNRAGVDENELLSYFGDDPDTRVVLLYVESLSQGRRFLEVAREVTEKKPVLVIKSGRTPLGAAAARSHTGSLVRANSDRLYDSLFAQAGVLRADGISELFQMAKVFANDRQMAGPRLVILTNSGGPGILAADAASRSGLTLPELAGTTVGALRRILSPNASIRNPVDMTADADLKTYRESLRTLLRREGDALLLIATPTGNTTARDVAEAVLAGRAGSRKPVVSCLFGLTDLSEEVARLESQGIPNFEFPEQAVTALASLARYGEWRRRPRTRTPHFRVDRTRAGRILRAAQRAGRRELAEYRAAEVLQAYGFQIPPRTLASSAEAAGDAAERLGYPVVLKIASPDILHKTDVGGVALHLTDRGAVEAAARRMADTVRERQPRARWGGYLVEKEIRGGREVILGAQRDPEFGPLVLFGLGGVYVEVLKDVTFRLAPLRALSARNMVGSIQGADLLRGVRGEGPSDLPALEESILRLSQLIVEEERIAEIDVNPLLVLPRGEGAVAVDARIVLAEPPSSRSAPRASRRP